MSTDFTHLIITRFNLNFGDLYKTKYGEDVHSDDWLSQRFTLFENYCFPSVRNQLNQNFKWLVFFDSNTPDAFKQKVTEYSSQFLNFIPVYVPTADVFLPEIKSWICNNISTEYIITSRLDNDDMLRQDFVKTIQENFEGFEHLIDVPNGLQLNLEQDHISLVKSYKKFGPFITLIENTTSVKSVYHHEHQKWKGHIKRKALSRGLWVQVIHDKNVLNRFRGRENYLENINVLSAFGLNEDKIAALRRQFVSHGLTHNLMVPAFKLRSIAEKILKITTPKVSKNT